MLNEFCTSFPCRSSKNFTSGWNITHDALVAVEEDDVDSGKFVTDLTGATRPVYWNAPIEMLKNQVCYFFNLCFWFCFHCN